MSNSYLPLHHKYRPQRFDDLVGQTMIAKTLKQALVTNKIAPAYLFCGPRGTGKTSSARILARSLNCLKSPKATTNPCGKCEVCKTISNGTALDVIEIDAASNTGVDNIRDLIEKSRFAPVQARWKVYVIDECHMLSTAAFNALLKTLEEPPTKSVFVLATTDPQRLLPTIISRCQRFDFRRIQLDLLQENIEEIAENEGIKISKDAINVIASRSQGGLRDAQRMLDQLSLLPQPIEIKSVWELLGEVPEKEIISLTYALTKKDPISVVKICRDIIDSGNEPIAIIQGIASILRDLIIKKTAPNEHKLCSISDDLHNELQELSLQVESNTILIWQAYLKGTEIQIRQSYQPRLWLEVLLLGMLAEKNALVKKNIGKKEIEKEDKQIISPIDSNDSHKKNIEAINYKKEKESQYNQINEELSDNNLNEIWEAVITKVELPSTRMLLSQQASLRKLTKDSAEINVSSNWIGMIQSRKNILEEAILKALGTPRKLIISSGKAPGLDKIQAIDETNSDGSIPVKKRLGKDDSPHTKDKSLDKHNTQKIDSDTNTNLDEKTQRFADFFNGEIVDP